MKREFHARATHGVSCCLIKRVYVFEMKYERKISARAPVACHVVKTSVRFRYEIWRKNFIVCIPALVSDRVDLLYCSISFPQMLGYHLRLLMQPKHETYTVQLRIRVAALAYGQWWRKPYNNASSRGVKSGVFMMLFTRARSSFSRQYHGIERVKGLASKRISLNKLSECERELERLQTGSTTGRAIAYFDMCVAS